jgi:hypothetical protein
MSSEAEKLAKKIFGKSFIKPRPSGKKKLVRKYKIIVFVPLENTDEVTFAMASAGAGVIGNYTVCSFRMKGVGTFMGGEGSNQVIGEKNSFEMTEEVRLEMICSKKNLDDAIKRMYEVHPYDEPAFEVYEVLTGTKPANTGLLYIPLKKKLSVNNLVKKLNPYIKTLNLPAQFTNTVIKNCIIDCREGTEEEHQSLPKKTLYINKSNNKIKAYFT